MGGVLDLVRSHPWHAAAAVAVPVAVAAWAAVGSHLLESRHGEHVFGARDR
jgi:hypothetical protein